VCVCVRVCVCACVFVWKKFQRWSTHKKKHPRLTEKGGGGEGNLWQQAKTAHMLERVCSCRLFG